MLHEMAGPERTSRRIAALADGSKGQEFWAGLDIRPADLIVNKDRYSAFIQGSLRHPPRCCAREASTRWW